MGFPSNGFLARLTDTRAVVMQKTGGNVTRAAELAGVSRRFLQRLAARLGFRAGENDS